ncbi:MAG TPA: IS630 family transposase [Phycisphaerales bacterium]|nr:IS630 family transposase [Phycisphaerales bacterium]
MSTVRDALAPLAGDVRVFFMDEARFGQQGTTTRMWAPRGSRPTAVKQTRYEWVYLYAAVEPATGFSVGLQAPLVNTPTMNVFLKMLSAELGPMDHAVLIMDGAGWHKSKTLRVPDNITILILPPYSPELNPVERLWAYLRSHYLSNRIFDDYQHLLDAGAEAWQDLTTETLRSVCACDYITPELER